MKVNGHLFWRALKKYPRQSITLIVAVSVLFTAINTYKKSARFVSKKFFACSVVDIECIDCYSSAAKKELVAFVRTQTANVNFLSFRPADFYTAVRNRFAYVTKVSVSKRMPTGLRVRVNCVKPALLLNDSIVLGHNKGVYSNTLFSNYKDLKKLPNINTPMLHAGMHVTPWAFESLTQLATDYSATHTLTFFDATKIRLAPKTTALYEAVIANESTLKQAHILDGLDTVVHDALRRGLCSLSMLETKRRSIELDVRFDRRIIVKFIDRAKRRGKVS